LQAVVAVGYVAGDISIDHVPPVKVRPNPVPVFRA
jgi:hypothetical protein